MKTPVHIILTLVATLLTISTSEAATITAASCSSANIQAAINAAVAGDLVRVPAGNCTWTGGVLITNKQITLEGAGSSTSGTVLTLSDTNRLTVNNTGKSITIKGFRVLGQAADNGLWRITGTFSDLRITANHFQWTSTGDSPDGVLQISGNIIGVIDHNTFAPTTACTSFRSAIAIQSDSETAAYARPSILGTGNAIFVETNTFTQAAYCGSTHAVWAQTGGSYVARYNTLTNWTFDVHGPCSWRGARQFEIYENDFIATSNIFATCVLRGGSGVYYSNRVTTNGNTVGNHRIRMQEVDDGTFCNAVNGGNCYACDSTSPWNYQLGRGTNNALDPIYFWGNRKDNVAISTTVQTGTSCACQNGHSITFYAQADRDWFDSTSTAKPGYVAYTYPHPLINGGGTDLPPDPPRNLRVL